MCGKPWCLLHCQGEQIAGFLMQGACAEPKTGAEGKSSRAKSGGSKRAKGKASQDGETTGQLESNLKPVEGVSQSGGGWDALIAAEASADTGEHSC